MSQSEHNLTFCNRSWSTKAAHKWATTTATFMTLSPLHGASTMTSTSLNNQKPQSSNKPKVSTQPVPTTSSTCSSKSYFHTIPSHQLRATHYHPITPILRITIPHSYPPLSSPSFRMKIIICIMRLNSIKWGHWRQGLLTHIQKNSKSVTKPSEKVNPIKRKTHHHFSSIILSS